jgi:3-hydroxybutyryl-CoA dehydratase
MAKDFQRYDDVAIGDIMPPDPIRFEANAEVVDAFLKATGNDDPRYRDGDAVRRVPSMLASFYLIDLLNARRSPPGGIHAKQAVRFHRSTAIGETLHLQARIVEKYTRKERPYVVAEFEARADDGALVASGRITSIWGKDA